MFIKRDASENASVISANEKSCINQILNYEWIVRAKCIHLINHMDNIMVRHFLLLKIRALIHSCECLHFNVLESTNDNEKVKVSTR